MQSNVYGIFLGLFGAYLDAQMLFLSKMNDICLESLLVMI